ncbi:hypothetical protein AYO20_01064 [Fonsecaea nubica]|uniref:BZIP domain-containing protein n=1 Tax=Fonsecaea nubica TaxID=856822 RepID=A0A178DDB4_9EURO|nr:hypothetical protein AYO20_01064 [Fonsecaea nubica]OAL39667.1 hypothetical protein AYO20_01064 [Fonsecaea nubica]
MARPAEDLYDVDDVDHARPDYSGSILLSILLRRELPQSSSFPLVTIPHKPQFATTTTWEVCTLALLPIHFQVPAFWIDDLNLFSWTQQLECEPGGRVLMARPRATPSPHAKDGESGSKSGWKDKLTAQQLSRKRAADRQLVRENRSKARQTIAALQERLDLLSTQQSDKIVAELLKENRNLEAEKETLRSKLQSICSALGLSREESSSLLQQSSHGSTTEGITSREGPTVEQPENEIQHAIVDSGRSVPFYTEGQTLQVDSIEDARSQCDASFDLTTELDSRMAVPDSPSPFPGIWAALGRLGSRSNLLDDDFLEAIMIWRSKTGHSGGGVFSVANALFHIARPPGLMSQQRLRSLARTPNILYLLVQDLESSEPSSNPALESMVPTRYPDSDDDDDSLTIMRRELAIAAYEAIRPGIRTHLMRDWKSYQSRNLYSSFVEHFDVQIPTDAKRQEVLQVDSNGCDIRLMPSTERWLHDINCLRMGDEFAVDFPELTELIRPTSGTEDPLGSRNSYADTRVAVGTLPPVNTAQLSIRANTPTAFSVTSSVEAVICSVGAAGAQEAAVDSSTNTTYLDDSFDRAFSFAEMQPPLPLGLTGVQQQPVSQAETIASEVDSASSIATTAPLPVISELGRSSVSDSASTKETQHDNMAWDPFVSASPADRTYRLDPSLSEWGAMSSWSATEDDSLFGSSSLWFPAWPSA